ncbi:MAG: FHA domain-containing protein [Bacteroidetes Order II. Incertae sedis bacterium]|nr:FHA domain-containing protein [Bacteroidetes Order II. bacterium]
MLSPEKRAILSEAMHHFIASLRPYLVEKLSSIPNSTWLRQYRSALPEPQRSLFDAEVEKSETPEELIDFGHLKSISQQHRPLLREDAGPKAANFPVWFEEINDVRTLWAHHRPITPDDADHAFRCMIRIAHLLHLSCYDTLIQLRRDLAVSAPIPVETSNRPNVETILDTLLTALEQHAEKISPQVIVVPDHFVIELHPEAFRALTPLFTRIRNEACIRLDEAVTRLTKPTRITARILEFIWRSETPIVEKSTTWQIEFEDAEDAVSQDYLSIEARFSTLKPTQRGTTTHLTRRFTVRLPDGVTSAKVFSRPDALPTTIRKKSSDLPLARLFHNGTAYDMRKTEITIGRLDEEAPAASNVDIRLKTGSSVSRSHCQIRYQDGYFYIRNMGKYGTTLQGRPLPNASPDDENWDLLPRNARIALGGEAVVVFEALL